MAAKKTTGSSLRKKTAEKKTISHKRKNHSGTEKIRAGKPLTSNLLTESKYKAVVEQASDPLFIHDFNGKFVEVNDKACKSLGYTRDELLSLTVMDVEQDFDLKSAQKEWKKISEGVNFTLRGRQIRKDGTVFPVDVRFGMFSQSGKKFIIGFVKNISEDIKEEERNKKTEERYRLTLDTMLEGAQIIDFDWKYIYLNSAAERHNKRPNDELLGKIYTDMWPGVENTEVYAILKRCMFDRIPHHFENLFVYPDGTEGWFELSVQPVPEGIFILSIDITERKTAEEKYRESREQFYGLYKSSRDAILLTVPDGEVLAANDGACRMFQRTEEEICRLGREGLVDLTDKRLPGLIQERKENSEAIGELTFVRKDGTKFTGEISSTIFHDSKGNPRTSMIIRDISEWKTADNKLRESESRFRNIFEQAPFGMVVVNREMKFSAANNAFCELTGYSEAELKNLTIRDITHPDDFPNDTVNVTRLISGELPVYKTEKRYIRKDGKIFWAYLMATANFSTDGKFLYNVATTEDITERKQYEESLRELAERLNLATNSAKLGVWDWDIKNNILTWDDRMYELYGIKNEDFPGAYEAWLNGLHPEDRNKSYEISQKAVKGEIRYDTEFRVIWPDGSVHWLKANGEVFRDDSGVPVRMVGVNYDITGRKKTEKELLLSNERFYKIFHESPTPMVISSPENFQILDANKNYLGLIGYELNEIIGKTPFELNLYANVGQAVITREKIINDSGYNEQEIKLRRKSGEIRDIIAWSRISNLNENTSIILGTALDVTDKKKTENSYKEILSKFETIVKTSPQAIIALDKRGIVTVWNEAAQNIFGWRQDEVIGKPNPIVPPDKKDEVRKIRDRVLNGETILGQERRRLKKNGEEIFISSSVTSLRDASGNVMGILSIAEDITERKMAEQTLVDSEKKYRYLFDNNPLPMWIYDLETLEFLEVNEAAVNHYGYTRNDFHSMTLREIRPSEDIDRLLKDVDETVDVINFAGEWRHKKKNGDVIYVEIISHFIDFNGRAARLVLANDITEKVSTRNKLIESEERFRQVVDSSGVWVWEVDRHGIYTYVSGNEENILGYPVDEILNKKHFYDFFVPELKESMRQAAMDAIGKRQVFVNFENPNLHKDGHTVYLETSGLPIYDAEGNFTGYRGADRDVTPRHLAIDALKESEASLQQAQSISRIGNWDYNLISKKVVMSKECFSIFELDYKIPPENLFGEILNVILPEERTGLLEIIEEIRSTGKEHDYEYRIQTPDGRIKHIYSVSQVVRNSGGDVIALHGIIQDVTKSKQAEEEIKKLSRALEQSPASVVITNLAGNIEYVNPKFTEMTGYQPEEILGKNPRILKSNVTSVSDYKNLWDTIISGNEWKGEFYNRKKNGENYWVSASLSAIRNVRGEITHYLAVEEDITEKKRKEAELIEAKNQAEEMNRLKSNFLTNMSHELRTPMVAILGFSEILLNSSDDPEIKEQAEMINKGANRLMETLNLVLNLSVIEAEKLEIIKTKVDIAAEVREVISLFEKEAGRKGLYLKMEQMLFPLMINIDKRVFRESMNNLVNNAIKFTETGGITVTFNKKNDNGRDILEIRVIDTGIGIPKEMHEIIWDEYRQVSEGYSRSFEGTGLGLTITKKFIQKMGGDVIVEESENGKGTTFLLSLPLEPLSADTAVIQKEKESRTKPDEIFSGKNVLYVDDDEMSINLIKIYLKDVCVLDAAGNGIECITMASEKKYDAVLVDINLGRGADGLETALKLKSLPGYDKIPIIAVTAFAMEGDKEEFLDKGCTHYISKPFKREDLISLVAGALESKQGG